MSDAMDELVKKAATDPAFAEELGRNPSQALAAHPNSTRTKRRR
jgi:hypothetical protein